MSEPGALVGPYRLVERLGRGGMGEVWLAEDPTGASGGAPRRVALKLLDLDLAADPDVRARFEREVDAAGRVRGACVAALLDHDLDAARPWLAAEYVAGPTLAEHVGRHGPLGEVALRALGAALADALVSIHAAGVVHRDLTPRNVVLGPDGPRVVDFGIAWFPGAATLTRTGTAVGTPAWMAPEQLTDDRATAASDVWAWGAVMAYAARGRPVVSASRPEVVAVHLSQGRLDLEGLPAWLDARVRAALAADPAVRPTAEALLTWITGRHDPSADTVPELLARTWLAPTVEEPVPDEVTEVVDRAVDEAAERRSARSAARWGSAVLIVAAALWVGLTFDLLFALIVFVVLVVVTVAVRLGRERLEPDARPIPPTWAIGLAAPVVLGAGLSQVVGVIGAVVALLVLLVLFFLLGGDLS